MNLYSRYKTSKFSIDAVSGNPKILEYFIKSGFDVNSRDIDGDTPLMQAVRTNNLTNAKILIIAGANINARDNRGLTPLLYAIKYTDSSIVKFLIESGAEVDVRDNSGVKLTTRAALLSCKSRGMLKVNFKILLRHASDIDLVQFMEHWEVSTNIQRYEEAIKSIVKYFLLFNPEAIKPNFTQNLSMWWDNCRMQVLRMNQHKLGKSFITMRNYLLGKDLNRRTSYMSNNTTGIRQELESGRSWYKENADLYGDMFIEYSSEDLKRAKLLHKWNVISQERMFKKTTVTARLLIAEHLSHSNLEWFVFKKVQTNRQTNRQTDNQQKKIKSAKDAIIPELSIKLINAFVEAEDGEYIIEENHKMFQTNGLRLARSLINVVNKETYIWITNPYPRPLKILKNQTLCFGSQPAEVNLMEESEQKEHEEPQFQINENLAYKEKEQLKQVLERYEDLFSSGLGRSNLAKHRIDTEGAKPIKHKPYRVSAKEREIIKEQIDEMLRDGIIRPSSSPWSFPVILVKKRDGKYRFCVDYRKLNDVTVKDVYPIPRIDQVLETLQGSKYFSAIDLKSGYWQVEVEEKDKEKTAFTTAHGLYEFNVMPLVYAMPLLHLRGTWKICLVILDGKFAYVI
ncbi:hypothetical protein LAZ67_21000316 [Cordylochernes scorpioides]|uniref:Reverse transcriptase domain-containing protein n=1 Tax=Cordylochernes scorpioides TaxID=51811 RepID=A0ABY6LQ51_9ARAC|nr:hypothetical protein LAZ67_21000316 [Cordylochernes scorpioides]